MDTVTFQGIEFPIALKDIIDYYKNISNDFDFQDLDEETEAQQIANNPLGIEGFHTFKEVLIQGTIDSLMKKLSESNVGEEMTNMRKLINSNSITSNNFNVKNDLPNIQSEIEDIEIQFNDSKRDLAKLSEMEFAKGVISSAECQALNIDYAARASIEVIIRSNFNTERSNRVELRATEISIKRDLASSSGRKGAIKRWKPAEKTKKFAIELFNKGTFTNPSQAAGILTEEIFNYGKSIGFHFSDMYQANRTIYNWLLSTKKQKNNQK